MEISISRRASQSSQQRPDGAAREAARRSSQRPPPPTALRTTTTRNRLASCKTRVGRALPLQRGCAGAGPRRRGRVASIPSPGLGSDSERIDSPRVVGSRGPGICHSSLRGHSGGSNPRRLHGTRSYDSVHPSWDRPKDSEPRLAPTLSVSPEFATVRVTQRLVTRAGASGQPCSADSEAGRNMVCTFMPLPPLLSDTSSSHMATECGRWAARTV